MIIKRAEYTCPNNHFSIKLTNCVKSTKNSKQLLLNADNSGLQTKQRNKKYLVENIAKTYKKPVKGYVNAINKSTRKIAEKLNIADKMV